MPEYASAPLNALPPPQDYPAEPLLRTRRMQLRGFCYRDAFDLLRLGHETRVVRLLLDEPISTLAEAAALVDLANRVYRERPGLGIWRADDENGTFIGFFSLMPEPDRDEVGIGTRLLPRAWGRGYALEGGLALCEHAFSTLRLPYIVGLCDPDNRSVPPLLMRLGFLADGEAEQRGKPALRFILRQADWSGLRKRR